MMNLLRRLFGARPQPPAMPTPAPDSEGRAGLVYVSDADFEERILRSDKLALVDLWADWCGPCHMLAPTIESLAAEYDGRVIVAKLDVDENPRTASRFNIMGIPTVLFIRNGKEIDRMVGVQPYVSFANRIERLLQAG